MSDRGILTVISGFSGAGKGTIVNRLLDRYPDLYCLSVSATTRAPRQGEKDGVSYFFVNEARFEEMIESGQLLEYAKYVGNYYGTPKEYVMEKLAAGIHVVLEIEMQGAFQVRERYPDALLLFVTPPRAEDLKDRLVNRGTETKEQIYRRLCRAQEETAYMKSYDYLIINDEVDQAVSRIHQIILNEKDRISRRHAFIDEMTAQLTQYVQELSVTV